MITHKELAEILERVENAKPYGEGVGKLALEDIPRLVAEVERLRDMVDKLHEQLRKADENIDRVEFELAIVKGREAMDTVVERIKGRDAE